MGSSTSSETQTATQTIPAEVTAANAAMLARGQKLADLGYIPYMGVDVAGINPAERAAMENVGQMASAFGLAAPAAVDIGMPEVTTGGMTGYSGFPIYEGALERFRETRPDQYEAYAEALGYDPLTGEKKAAPVPVYSAPAAPAAAPASPMSSAPAGAAYFSGGQYYRADGSGIGAGSDKGAGFSGGFGNAPMPSGSSFSGYSSTGAPPTVRPFERNLPTPTVGEAVGDFISGGGLMGAIGRAMSGASSRNPRA